MNKFLKKLKKVTKNEYAFVADEEENVYSGVQTTNTGCYILNALMSGDMLNGGIVDGRRYLIAGDPSTGKSFLSMLMTKTYLDEHENSIAVVLESEGSTIIEMCESINIDKSRLLVLPVKTVEDCRTQILKVLADLKELNSTIEDKTKKQKMIILVDSLGNLSTNKEISDIESGSDTRDMTRAQLLKGFGRATSLELSLCSVPMIMVSHTYASMDMYSPSVIGGGSGSQYIADVAIVLTKGKEKEGSVQTGVVVKATIRKSRFVHEGKSGKIIISFKHGLYPYSSLAEIAHDLGVFIKEGISFLMPDGTKARMKEVRTNFKKFATEQNMEELNKAIIKHFKFGSDEESEIFEIEEIESDE